MRTGIAAASGIGIGRAVVLAEPELHSAWPPFSSVEEEKARFWAAAEEFDRRTRELAEGVARRGSLAESEILLGQMEMLRDPYLTARVEEQIQQGCCAGESVEDVCREYADLFAALEDEMMAQRAADVADMGSRMVSILTGREERDLSDLTPDTVLIARELTPAMTAGLGPVAAMATERGGLTSHTAILARSMGLPAVVGAAGLLQDIREGDTVIVDGTTGVVIPRPTPEELAEYRRRQAGAGEDLAPWSTGPTHTADGEKIALLANVGAPAQTDLAAQQGAEGVGLLRTEFLFLGRDVPPGEEEQVRAYLSVLKNFPHRPVIIRTLDVGGDKEIPWLPLEKEDDPFLGVRGVRLTLAREELLRTQLRAILRVSPFGRVKLMLPMVTCLEEVARVREILGEERSDLTRAGVVFDDRIPLGVMVETPAAVWMAEELAGLADFFSIGTNDLTQYIMAADRGNPGVAGLYHFGQPALLRSVAAVIRAGKRAHIPVGMCGEMAAQPQFIPVLLGMGLEEFSVDPAALPAVRREVARWRISDCEALAKKVLSCSTLAEVLKILR